MHINDDLEKKLLEQPFTEETDPQGGFLQLAMNYARLENAIAVLSDMKTNTSHICYGGLAERLHIAPKGTSQVIHTIWEEGIFHRIHPDDLQGKHLEELRFYHFIMEKTPEERLNYYLHSHLRMKDATGTYLPVLHRMFYLTYDTNGCARLALCLYNLSPVHTAEHWIVNSQTGETIKPEAYTCEYLLSEREREVLQLLERGYMSKEIATSLYISVNTVNRHRQNILQKLQAGNSVEACRIAKDLRVI